MLDPRSTFLHTQASGRLSPAMDARLPPPPISPVPVPVLQAAFPPSPPPLISATGRSQRVGLVSSGSPIPMATSASVLRSVQAVPISIVQARPTPVRREPPPITAVESTQVVEVCHACILQKSSH